MVIRALDYAPPVNLEFCDFLSAVLTSDREINPNDSRYHFRDILREMFIRYGIESASAGTEEIENWSYALSKPAVKRLLAGVDLYKVGHHGSRNATRRSLWNSFDKRSDKETKNRLETFVSTMPGKHGKAASKTEVPRKTLVEALKGSSNYHTTEDLKPKEIRLVHTINFR